VAPPGNQAATEKTNINLYHSENPVYSPKVGPALIADELKRRRGQSRNLGIIHLLVSSIEKLAVSNVDFGMRNAE
jgi:hypothetical protein